MPQHAACTRGGGGGGGQWFRVQARLDVRSKKQSIAYFCTAAATAIRHAHLLQMPAATSGGTWASQGHQQRDTYSGDPPHSCWGRIGAGQRWRFCSPHPRPQHRPTLRLHRHCVGSLVVLCNVRSRHHEHSTWPHSAQLAARQRARTAQHDVRRRQRRRHVIDVRHDMHPVAAVVAQGSGWRWRGRGEQAGRGPAEPAQRWAPWRWQGIAARGPFTVSKKEKNGAQARCGSGEDVVTCTRCF